MEVNFKKIIYKSGIFGSTFKMNSEKLRKGNSYTSSPVAANVIIYKTDNEGEVYSVITSSKYELLAENKLNQTVMSTPAIAENYLFFRTTKGLIAVSKK